MANIIKKNNDNFVPDLKSGFNRMLSDNYAFIGGSYYFDSMDPETRCQVYQVGEPLATVLNAVGVQKREIISSLNSRYLIFMILDSNLTNKINKAIVDLYMDGTFKILRSRWLGSRDNCKNDVSSRKGRKIKSFSHHSI